VSQAYAPPQASINAGATGFLLEFPDHRNREFPERIQGRKVLHREYGVPAEDTKGTFPNQRPDWKGTGRSVSSTDARSRRRPRQHLAGLGPHPIARHITGHPHLSGSGRWRKRASYRAETASQTAACNARISVTVAEVLARPSPHSAATPKSLRCSRAADTLWRAPSTPSLRCTSPR
jgi:hypothetical protein